MRISDWSSDVCSSDLLLSTTRMPLHPPRVAGKTACASRTGRGPQAAITFSFIRTLSTAAVRSGRLRPFCLARRGAPGVIIMTTRMLIYARHREETLVAGPTGNRNAEYEFNLETTC